MNSRNESRTDRLIRENTIGRYEDDRGGLIFDMTFVATVLGLIGLVVRFML